MESNLVSVIITTYKATRRLSEAILSVLNQSYKNIEIIVVDDNDPATESRLLTESLVKPFGNKIQYICHSHNMNGATARNTGVRNSKGEYIAFLDDDDIFYPSRIEKCVALLGSNPEYAGVYSSVDLFCNDKSVGVRNAYYEGTIWKELLLNEGLLGTGSNLFLRRSAVEEVNGFDERFLRYQDVEFLLRVCEKKRIAVINEVLVRKNLETTNIPQYPKYKENKKLIFQKFAYLITKLNENERKQFFSIHYDSLLTAAVSSRNREYINEARKDIKDNIGRLTMKQRIKSTFPGLYCYYLNLKSKS